jgi:hypothetical protein
MAFASVLIFLVQTHAYPNAGKNNISKFSEYSFQMSFWSEEIYDKFDLIKQSNSYKKLSLYGEQKTASKEFFDDIEEYHYQIKALLRVLKQHAGVAVNVMTDSQPLLTKAGGKIGIEKLKIINENYEQFSKNLKIYNEKINEIENYIPELRSSFSYQDGNLSEDEKIELTIKQVILLQELYSSEHLFLKHGSDPFKFVRDFAVASKKVLIDYREINTAYNDVVNNEQIIKDSIILFFLFIAAYLTFRKDSQP